jgi:putative hydrolase of the HAD superfamily
MKIEAIIFDYGNVLSLPQDEKLWREIAQKCCLSLPELEKHYWDLRADYDGGNVSGVDYWHEIAKRGGCEMNEAKALEVIDMDNRSWSRENERMSAFGRAVRKAGMRTAILSNMPLDFRNFLSVGVTWLPEFDHHTYSCELHVIKPDVRIYEHCVNGLGIAPEKTLFIDDRLPNIEAAQALGIQCVLFETTEQTLADCAKLCGEVVATN